LGLLFIGFTSPDPVKRKYSISQRWLTYPSESILFQPTAYESGIKSKPDKTLNIDINEQKVYQEMDGFGFTLTGGSARLINQMSTTNKKELLYELFSATEGIGISYLRLSIGASDLSDSVFTYNDMPPGKTDPQLSSLTWTWNGFT
jgi:glucosylceramidase